MAPVLNPKPAVRAALACLLGWTLACNGDKPEAADAPPVSNPVPNPSANDDEAPPRAELTPPSDAHDQLLAWLDPEAISVGFNRLPKALDPHITAAVYALPPRAEDLLGAPNDIDHAIESVQPAEAPAIDCWLGPESLVVLGRFASRPTVLRPLVAPRKTVGQRLEAMGLQRAEDDVFEVWEPKRVFPYRVVLVDDTVAAFIPASEPGTGLRPLAAARDMPESEVEGQLREVLDATGGPAVALFAAGPMMHFDLDADVLAVRFELRNLGKDALDGQTVLQLDGDPQTAVSSLTTRTATELNDQVQALMKRTAFVVDAGVVAGRLQLPANDARLLYEDD